MHLRMAPLSLKDPGGDQEALVLGTGGRGCPRGPPAEGTAGGRPLDSGGPRGPWPRPWQNGGLARCSSGLGEAMAVACRWGLGDGVPGLGCDRRPFWRAAGRRKPPRTTHLRPVRAFRGNRNLRGDMAGVCQRPGKAAKDHQDGWSPQRRLLPSENPPFRSPRSPG